MTGSRPAGVVPGVKAGALSCLAAATTLAVIAAMTVTVAGLGDEARSVLRFGFGGVERSPAEAARIAVHNGRVAGGTLLCAAIAPRIGVRARRIVFLVLAMVLASSAIGVGIAIGAYGTRVIA